MTFSKTLKAAASSAVLGITMVAMPTTAQAQIPVTDGASIARDVVELVTTQGQWAKDVAHYANQISEYKKQWDQIERQFTQIEREWNSISGLKFSDILNISDDLSLQTATDLFAASQGNATEFGWALPGDMQEKIKPFNEARLFVDAEVLYPDSPELQAQIQHLYETAYMASSTLQVAHEGQQTRRDIYDTFSRDALAAEDLKGALEVNNAILIENGRNLALLIDIQSAMLGSETVELDGKARGAAATHSLYGASNEDPS